VEKEKWNKRYASTDSITQVPALLAQNIHLLSGGKALDVAMGMGHNALFLASHGYAVDGIDISSVAVAHVRDTAIKNRLPVHAVEADLTHCAIAENRYNLIINFYFLERDLIPRIKNGLRPGGLLFFETYTIEQRRFGRPSNPDYLLAPNELLRSFLDLFIIVYHERVVSDESGNRAIASLIAQKV
jgi:SAM-dependent methyltransferase